MARNDEEWWKRLPRRFWPGPLPTLPMGAACPRTGKPLVFGACSGCEKFLDVGILPVYGQDAILCGHPGQAQALADFAKKQNEPKQGSLF